MVKIIDTHQHLWDLKRLDLPWLIGLPALNHSFWIDQYLEATADQPIQKSVYMEVNSAPQYKDLEIELITALCANPAYPTSGMIIAVDPCNPSEPTDTNFEATLDKHRGNHYIKGIRQVLHTPDQPKGYCLQNQFIKNLQKLANRDLLFDICIRPGELSDAVKLAKHCPDTRFVIDHCGNANPKIINGEINFDGPPTPGSMEHGAKQWRDEMAELGALPNTICKVSGLVTGLSTSEASFSTTDAAFSTSDAAALAPILAATVNHCLDVFAEDRVIFGGDWPVCTLGASLDAWLTALREIVATRPQAQQNKLFSENAEQIYSL